MIGLFHSEDPTEVIHKDEAPIHLGEEKVKQPEYEGRSPAPVQLCACHAVGAHLVDSPCSSATWYLQS